MPCRAAEVLTAAGGRALALLDWFVPGSLRLEGEATLNLARTVTAVCLSAGSLLDVINQVLDYSKVASAEIELEHALLRADPAGRGHRRLRRQALLAFRPERRAGALSGARHRGSRGGIVSGELEATHTAQTLAHAT
jgi:hypothetical protein